MGDSLMTITAIVLAAVLMFIFPLMSVSDRSDDISQLSVNNTTVQYVDNIKSTGKLSLESYTKFLQTLASTGNSYDVEIELKVLDENIGKKATQTEVEKIGENTYYTLYTTQVMDLINPDPTNFPNGKTLLLKEGDIISVSVKNTNTTIAQTLRNAFYKITGNDTYQISAAHGGMILVNGK